MVKVTKMLIIAVFVVTFTFDVALGGRILKETVDHPQTFPGIVANYGSFTPAGGVLCNFPQPGCVLYPGNGSGGAPGTLGGGAAPGGTGIGGAGGAGGSP